MKKNKSIEKIGFDKETLKLWKEASTKAKLTWLEDALRFGKSKKK